MWIIKWCRKEEILHNFYAVLPESHKVDSKGLLVMFRPPVLFTTTMYYRTMPIENLKGWSLCTLPFNGPIKEILNDLQKKELPSLAFQKRRRSDHAKDIETGKILSIMSIKKIMCLERRFPIKQQLSLCGTRLQFNFMERFSELIKNLSDVPKSEFCFLQIQ